MEFDIAELIDTGINENVDQKKMLLLLAKSAKCGWDNFHTYKHLYKEIYGSTLCKLFCDELVSKLHNNQDHGRKWTIEQTNDLARKNNITFDSDYTEYEFNCVCHIMYYYFSQDLKDSGVSNENIYAKMADSYLDYPEGSEYQLVNYFFSVMSE